jgi:NitT/TauT family transport system ATP-binding protein
MTVGRALEQGERGAPDGVGAVDHIAVEEATVQYQVPGGRMVALQSATLRVRQQEFVSLIGPSGCGKTTLLKLIGGLLRPTSGTVSINGQSPDGARRRHQIGFAFQDPALLPWRSVLGNVMLLLEVTQPRGADGTERARALLELVGLAGFERYYPSQLSGGMRQRAAIARALAIDPAVLLMDEPLGALDAITRDRMGLELLRIWTTRPKTVVFVTHSIPEAVFLSDRVVVMSPRPGRIVDEIPIRLPRPREMDMRDSAEFGSYVKALRRRLEA